MIYLSQIVRFSLLTPQGKEKTCGLHLDRRHPTRVPSIILEARRRRPRRALVMQRVDLPGQFSDLASATPLPPCVISLFHQWSGLSSLAAALTCSRSYLSLLAVFLSALSKKETISSNPDRWSRCLFQVVGWDNCGDTTNRHDLL